MKCEFPLLKAVAAAKEWINFQPRRGSFTGRTGKYGKLSQIFSELISRFINWLAVEVFSLHWTQHRTTTTAHHSLFELSRREIIIAMREIYANGCVSPRDVWWICEYCFSGGKPHSDTTAKPADPSAAAARLDIFFLSDCLRNNIHMQLQTVKLESRENNCYLQLLLNGWRIRYGGQPKNVLK